jgi:putative effector of murein hydrolase
LTVGSGAAAVAATKFNAYSSSLAGPFTALFLLSTTLNSFVFGARLPKKFTKLVHPLVTCAGLTWTAAVIFASVTGQTFSSILESYKKGTLNGINTGAGDVLLFLLGPAVVSLAVSMYERRKLMRENLPAVGTSIACSTLSGLFGTAFAVRFLGIVSPYLRLSLLSRNITSPLAMAIAGILGADVSLAVSIVVVTGLIGANFGASILDAFGVKDAVARGLGIGAAAHGLGTAAFANEPDAFPFAAISMALTATAATVAVSIPFIRKILVLIALG